MRQYLALGGIVVASVAAGAFWQREAPPIGTVLHRLGAPAEAQAATGPAAAEPILVAPVSETAPLDKEAKRFNRYDKDKDGIVTRDEYLASRHKAFAKLDVNGDGKLSFDEWSVKVIAKFDAADALHTGKLTRVEFATTAVKHKPRNKAVCPPGVTVAAAASEEAEAP